MYFKRISDLHPVIEYNLDSLWVEASQSYKNSGDNLEVVESSPSPRLKPGETRSENAITSFEEMSDVDVFVSKKVSLAEVFNNLKYINSDFITAYYIEGKDSGNKNALRFNITIDADDTHPHISSTNQLSSTDITTECTLAFDITANNYYDYDSISGVPGAAVTIDNAGLSAKQLHSQFQFSVNYTSATFNNDGVIDFDNDNNPLIGTGISANCTGLTANNIFVPGEAVLTAAAAYWADLAELYKSDQNYPVGTLVKFGGIEEITIADDEVNAVVTEKPAYLMNTQIKNIVDFPLGIVLTGKSKVRVKNPINKFDKLMLSDTPGIATKNINGSTTIGIALETNLNEEEKLINAVLKLTF